MEALTKIPLSSPSGRNQTDQQSAAYLHRQRHWWCPYQCSQVRIIARRRMHMFKLLGYANQTSDISTDGDGDSQSTYTMSQDDTSKEIFISFSRLSKIFLCLKGFFWCLYKKLSGSIWLAFIFSTVQTLLTTWWDICKMYKIRKYTCIF